MNKPKTVTFKCSKDHFRRFEMERDGRKYSICHAYPSLGDYIAGLIPDNVNPRTHKETCLTKKVPKAIKETLKDRPEDFILANRGASIIADSVSFNPDNSELSITLSNYEDRSLALHGMADGATSDATIKEVQELLGREALRTAQFHLEIICGKFDRAEIGVISGGRNTSESVKGWSMDDWNCQFDWLKSILESGKFKGRVGFNENDDKPTDIRDIIAKLTTCHPEYEKDNSIHPTIAYTSKGTMTTKFLDKDMRHGYERLSPIVEDILLLSEHIYSSFEDIRKQINERANNQIRPGAWKDVLGEKVFPTKRHELPLTGNSVNVVFRSPFLIPILAACRCLIDFGDVNDKAKWRVDPFSFWDKHGIDIIETLLSDYQENGLTPNHYGKKQGSYDRLYTTAKMKLMEEVLAGFKPRKAVLV